MNYNYKLTDGIDIPMGSDVVVVAVALDDGRRERFALDVGLDFDCFVLN